MGPYLLENAPGYDEAVEAVEGRLEVDPRAQGPHPQKHFKDEQGQEDVLHNVCEKKQQQHLFIYFFQSLCEVKMARSTSIIVIGEGNRECNTPPFEGKGITTTAAAVCT